MYKKACQAHLWVHKGQVRIKILRPCEHDELRWLVESESEWDGELKTKRMFYTLVLLHQNTRIILSGYNRSELGGVAPISEYLNIVDYLKNRGISWQDPTQPWRNSTSR